MKISQSEKDLILLFEAVGGRDRDALQEALELLRSQGIESDGENASSEPLGQ